MKLSIITINYNNAIGLEKTILSIITLNKDSFEYIVIDGGSIDGSVDVVEQYSDKIDYWISEPDKGIYNAMNKGIQHASGEYLLFANSGDIINLDTDIDKLISNLSGLDLIFYNLKIDDINRNHSFVKSYPNKLDFKYFFEDSLPHIGSFIKRSLLLEHGCYSEQYRIVSDWAFFLDAVCLKRCSYRHVNDVFSTFYADGISSQPESRAKLQEEKDMHIEANYPLLYSLYKEWLDKKDELYKLKTSRSVAILKKIGMLKWMK